MLIRSQQRTICSQLGRVKLQLLYKASIHGFTSTAFHQRCDNHGPTVSVGYNASGYVFGGYTKQPFSQSGQYVRDDEAFLFTFSGEKLLKYPVTNPAYAVKMISSCGPYFGEDLALVHGNKAIVYNNPGHYYNFSAADMHGNNFNLIDCEVYRLEGEFSLINQILMFSMFQTDCILNQTQGKLHCHSAAADTVRLSSERIHRSIYLFQFS